MRCVVCRGPLDGFSTSIVVCFVVHRKTYTACMHLSCMRGIAGPKGTDRLLDLAFRSGWVQDELPGFLEESQPSSRH